MAPKRPSWALGGSVLGLMLLAAVTSGCRNEQAEAKPSASGGPVVHVVKPELRTIDYAVDQPGFVEAFEQTAIYSKVSGFIEKFYVDIGDQVKKGELLVEIFVPELDEDHQQKAAQVELDEKLVDQAEQLVVVAESNVQTADRPAGRGQANVGKYEAESSAGTRR